MLFPISLFFLRMERTSLQPHHPSGCSAKGRADTDMAHLSLCYSFPPLMTSLGIKHEHEPF